jgi:hypothetical protein
MPGRPMLLCAQKGGAGGPRSRSASKPESARSAAMVALAAAAAVMAQPRAQRR